MSYPQTAGEKLDRPLTKAANGFCMTGFYKAKYIQGPAQTKGEFCTAAGKSG